MRITLSGAMRARDVSRPRDEQLAAAAEREAKAARPGRPGGAGGAGGPRGSGGAPATEADPVTAGIASSRGTACDEDDIAAPAPPADGGDRPSPTRRRRRRGR